ncbi:MAG: biotin--[acetyl-CoA-carboxylase] ligase [Chloroflexi bacterium]|nr:biotin--[acetyl-CoA-carboxylase] ligase [Chloroflexota bacterium]
MASGELTPGAVQLNLPTRYVGQVIHYYETLTSTQEEALRLARQGAPEGCVIIADEQTAGRGRFDRSWVAPKGQSILLSLVLRPELSTLVKLNMVASLAVVRAIRRSTGIQCQIKWPNDVLYQGKKLCGILIDTYFSGEHVDFSIVGLGLNVNVDVEREKDVPSHAVSLSGVLGRKVPRLLVLHCLLEEMELYYEAVKAQDPIHEGWRRYVETIGKPIRATMGERVEEGIAEGVDEDGNLLLRRNDGHLITLSFGQVTLRS